MNHITEKKSYLFGLVSRETTRPVDAASAPTKSAGKGIIANIVQEFTDRSRAEIKKWRDAIIAAENPEDPRWYLLQDIYTNLMTDGHLMANIEIRKAAVLSTRYYIQDNGGQEDEEKTGLLQTEWFYTILEHLLDTTYRGYTVLELLDPNTMQWELIPRRNVVPQTNRILFEVSGTQGVNFTDPAFEKNILWVKNINRLGILNDIVPQIIWKRNAQQAWADFSERFGIPMVTATSTKTDKKTLDYIEDMLRKLGQAANAVLPDGTEILIHDNAKKGDPYNVFDKQIDRTNSEISKRIVGGTMVSDQGSSRSQSEVHERTLDEKIAERDRLMIEFTVNNKLIPMLRNWGFSFADGDQFVFDRSEEMSLEQHWKIVKEAMQYYNIPEDWVSRRFNIPIDGLREKTQQTGGGIAANFR